ncbi:ATP-dependent helicase [Candidatus Saccharibacteria bacterium]|nr:ATP-dependent helicase [Candidatus Saccharibacteria bacterium]
MRLNAEQQAAVDAIEGPVLVVAGPGTGKTQLLAARVQNILEKTDADASNILCLTFTNDGARNMRERLRGLIGEASYKVTVGTYHEFGQTILRDYPEYFLGRRYLTLIDDLKAYQIFNGLVEEMSYTNALRYKEWAGVKALVGDVKKAALTPAKLRNLVTEGNRVVDQLEQVANEVFPARMPSKLDAVMPMFEKWREALVAAGGRQVAAPTDNIPSLAQTYLTELELAVRRAAESGKSTPLSKYKSNIMERVDDQFRLKVRKSNERLKVLADVYERYNDIIRAEGLYDFDDIILEAISAMESNDDLRAELQERYQYVLLDEYQDTNAAQSRIVELLLDNPMWEGQPNVLAVGDDDQAIYAFQGALASNLADFYRRYVDVKLINLSKNYRSSAEIVGFAAGFRKTILDGVYKGLTGEDKQLIAAKVAEPGITKAPDAIIQRIDFRSDVVERNWVAEKIKELIANGTNPSEIAVLARKNSELDSVAKHLGDVKIRYDRQNDILTEQRIVREFLDLCRLLVALRGGKGNESELAARVFYAKHWDLPVVELYKIAREAREAGAWIPAMLASENEDMRRAAEKVEELSGRLADVPLGEAVHELVTMWGVSDEESYTLNSALLILLGAVDGTLHDLVRYADSMIAAELNLLDKSPYRAAADAVSLLSAHKAKGLEFEVVFVIGAHNANWVKTGSHKGSTLPPNMQAISHSGDRDDDKRRLLYVAATRAKNMLYVTRAKMSFDGSKNYEPIEYLDERDEDGRTVALALPEGHQDVIMGEAADEQPATKVLADEVRRLETSPDLAIIAEQFVADYTLAASDVNIWIDSKYGGAERFYRDRVLRVPSAPSRMMSYGTLVHAVLQDMTETANSDKRRTVEQAMERFRHDLLQMRGVSERDRRLLGEQGEYELPIYLAANMGLLSSKAKAEKWFSREKDGVRMWGKVDRVESDGEARIVVDFKTGKVGGASDDKTHRAKVQLYFYKMLVESERGTPVTGGRIEFVGADSDGKLSKSLAMEFDSAEEALVWQLVQLVWQRIVKMDFREVPETGPAKTFREFLESKIVALS